MSQELSATIYSTNSQQYYGHFMRLNKYKRTQDADQIQAKTNNLEVPHNTFYKPES